MTTIFFAVHIAAAMLLSAYGCHRLFLAIRVLAVRSTSRPPPRRHDFPTVTVQIPLYNERYVATRALAAAAALDYPQAQLEIQVLDDSTDETSQLVHDMIANLTRRGVSARHVRRGTRRGFKAGALAYGLREARGELIAVFDADFVPERDFLRRLVSEFDDPGVGMVQARWGHLNADSSLLTRVQALQLDAHFIVEHGARSAMNCFFNFNGTAGIWRKRAIVSSGGWRDDTLTEDLDLSYRAQLAGWRFVYRNDVVVPAELPVEVAAYRVQQQRWAQGGVQTAVKLLPRIMRSPLRAIVKCEAFWHLTGHVAYLLLIVLALAGVGAGLFAGSSHHTWLAIADAVLIGIATLTLSAFYMVAAWSRGTTRWWREAVLIPPIMVLGAGIAFGQALAVGRGVFVSGSPFRRTPKYRNRGPGDRAWRHAAYRMRRLGPSVAECFLGISILVLATVSALADLSYPSGPVFLIGVGLASTGAGAFAQHPWFRLAPKGTIHRRAGRSRAAT